MENLKSLLFVIRCKDNKLVVVNGVDFERDFDVLYSNAKEIHVATSMRSNVVYNNPKQQEGS